MLTIEDIGRALETVGSDDLIVEPWLGFDKEATNRVSPDPSRWDINVVHALYEQHPYVMPEYQIDVQWIQRDDQQGYAVGAIILSNQTGIGYTPPAREAMTTRGALGSTAPQIKVAIPAIIKAFELSPLDVFQVDEKWYPLTERRLGQVFQPQELFAGVDRPVYDGVADRTLVDTLAPPYEAAYGNYSRYGGGYIQGGGSGGAGLQTYGAEGMGKVGVILPGVVNTQTILDRLMPAVHPEHLDRWKRHVTRTPTALVAFERAGKLDLLRRAATLKPSTGDDEQDWLKRVLPKDLIRLTKMTGGLWCVTIVSDQVYDPLQATLPREKVVEKLREDVPDIEQRLVEADDILIEGAERETVDPIVLEDLAVEVVEADSPGRYLVMTRRGEIREGSVFDQVLCYDGSLSPWNLWSDGRHHAISDKIRGDKLSDDIDLPEAKVQRGETVTFLMPRDGSYAALMPFTIRAIACREDHLILQGFDTHRREVTFIVTPGAQTMVSVTGISDEELGEQLSGNAWIVPADWMLVCLGPMIRLWEDPAHIQANLGWILNSELLPHGKEILDSDNAPTIETGILSLQSDANAPGRYAMKGSILDDVANSQRVENVSRTEAAFLLAVMGLSLEDARMLLDRAGGGRKIRVSNLRRPRASYREKTAELIKLAEHFNCDLFMEAAGICKARSEVQKEALDLDDESVESVLSLGLVNEDNLMDLLQSVPVMQEAESRLAELLMHTRLGFEAVPDDSVSRALQSLNAVVEDLEVAWALLRTRGGGGSR